MKHSFCSFRSEAFPMASHVKDEVWNIIISYSNCGTSAQSYSLPRTFSMQMYTNDSTIFDSFIISSLVL